MEWNQQQDAALTAVSAWLKNKRGPQVFRLFGYAGTGKTTLAKHIAEGVSGDVQFASFTGKAALVMRSKGCTGASTIHSLIYRPDGEDEESPNFVLNRESVLASSELAIIDEASMVNEDLGNDLLSFKKKILVLADPEQLPPVNGEGFFTNGQPNIMLTDVRRQAADNPIIRMSMDIREGRGLQFGEYGDSRVLRRSDLGPDEIRSLIQGCDQVLVGLNKTRQAYNRRIRQIEGRHGVMADHHPVEGDRLVCLRNNHKKGLLNGGIWQVTGASPESGIIRLAARSLDEDHAPLVSTTVPEEFFDGTEKSLEWSQLRGHDQFTYGYVITTHKAQGSQWNDLVVFDESRSFRDNARRHLYTSVTRAAERITVIA